MDRADALKDPLLKDLNNRQLEAALVDNKSCVVLAGAGSGKTNVLTRRAARLIRDGLVEPEKFLMVTFTNKAAKEMKTRLQSLLSRPIGNLWIGTFHGLCNRMLRENAADAGLPPGFAIMDEDDQLALIKRILKDIHSAPEDIEPKRLQDYINGNKERGNRPGRLEAHTEFEEFALPFYSSYETRCAREGVVDFCELLLRVCEMLEQNPVFLEKFRDSFTYIQVDEFQDTNAMQYAWLRALKGPQSSIFAVGDDDQSIYAFRGSDPKNMQDFVVDVADNYVIRLEQNYRSTGAILAAANSLIQHNKDRLGKDLWTEAPSGTPMMIHSFESDVDEADYVAKTIRRMIAKGIPPSEIAILYRSNYQSRNYEKSLMAHGIPHVIYGGLKFYARMEIKNVLAYMRLIANINDDGAFMRVINFPPRGIGERTIQSISEVAKEAEIRSGRPISLLEAASKEYEGNAVEKIDTFVGLLEDLFNAHQELNLPDFINYLIKTTGLADVYMKKGDEKDQERGSNLLEMITAAKRFCEESEIENALRLPASDILTEFMATATLETATDNGKDGERSANVTNAESVTLMTVHASKGLEFDAIIIGGIEDGVFPSEQSLLEAGEEEERRLMYVAITRAKKYLLGTFAKKRMIYGEIKDYAISRFLADISEETKSITEHPANYIAPQVTKTKKNWGGGNQSAGKKPQPKGFRSFSQ